MQTKQPYPGMTSHMLKNSYTKKTNKLVIYSILRHNLSKFVTQTGLYCSKQLETTFNQVGKKNRCISSLSTIHTADCHWLNSHCRCDKTQQLFCHIGCVKWALCTTVDIKNKFTNIEQTQPNMTHTTLFHVDPGYHLPWIFLSKFALK